MMAATEMGDFADMRAELYATFASGVTRSYDWRMRQLRGMLDMMTENSDAITTALNADLGRPTMESFLAEISATILGLKHTMEHLKEWMQPQAVAHPVTQQPGRSLVLREPKGVVLVISPWNFPVTLLVSKLYAVVAAGNCCVVKPSEISKHAEVLMGELLHRYVDPAAVKIVCGGVAEVTSLLKLPWDHIFFTGNGTIGRVVARAAAEHLTPITLELGGKNPTIVLPDANLKVAAKRILSSKCLNAGQICIAPDYILVHPDVEEALTRELRETLHQWYGDDASTSDSYSRIIDTKHFRRLQGLIESADGEIVASPGKMDESSKFIPPTLIRGPSSSTRLMQEEIFGPVLPIISAKSVDEMVERINSGEKPLALYIFGKEGPRVADIIRRVSSGGVCVNDTIFHFANMDLPFGGVGGSGTGKYHGKWGFDEFSHIRAVMYRGTWIDAPQRYPPYTDANMKLMEWILVGPLVPDRLKIALKTGVAFTFGVATAALAVRSRL
eukprot:TRINITY_DN63377_c0_g1_i1.p1 TRINITY_DN63377_c0_g1~~TRINITY_DN63377_c0_g1_i1.p1  ORF type:complete len:500 (-),score=71.67 TRINITY_DN63377_c0_g1_i1:56-1555(-)